MNRFAVGLFGLGWKRLFGGPVYGPAKPILLLAKSKVEYRVCGTRLSAHSRLYNRIRLALTFRKISPTSMLLPAYDLPTSPDRHVWQRKSMQPRFRYFAGTVQVLPPFHWKAIVGTVLHEKVHRPLL